MRWCLPKSMCMCVCGGCGVCVWIYIWKKFIPILKNTNNFSWLDSGQQVHFHFLMIFCAFAFCPAIYTFSMIFHAFERCSAILLIFQSFSVLLLLVLGFYIVSLDFPRFYTFSSEFPHFLNYFCISHISQRLSVFSKFLWQFYTFSNYFVFFLQFLLYCPEFVEHQHLN